MPIDGFMLSSIKCELENILIDAKVEKITQPEKDEIVLYLHAPRSVDKKNIKLLLCANPSHPKVHISDINKENPPVAPNFCMLLRKHLTASRIIGIEQPALERVLVFTFEARTEMYETVRRKISIEIMGRYSNIVFTDGNDIIYDAIRPVDFTTSAKRQLLPGLLYELPPKQNKQFLTLDVSLDDFDFSSEQRVDKFLLEKYQGFSPLLARELIFLSCGRCDARFSELTDFEKEKLVFQLKKHYSKYTGNEYSPQLLLREEPFDFYCFDINQYGMSVKTIKYDSSNTAVDEFYSEKEKSEYIKRRSSDILKILTNASSRLSKKIIVQTRELEDCDKAEVYKNYGDLIIANINIIKHGDKRLSAVNYWSENLAKVEIELNPSFSPSQNAQKYYKLYKKAQTAKQMLRRELPAARAELEYIESIFDSLVFAENLSDLNQIRKELADSGYVKNKMSDRKKDLKNKKEQAVKLSSFTSSEGIKIYIGKNNIQNDYLTLKVADKRDMWFHVKSFPGCHTVLCCSGSEYSDISMNEAASIAATFSKAAKGQKVEVDYTAVKNVKKPSGAKAGMVIYDNYKTAYIAPDSELAERLKDR